MKARARDHEWKKFLIDYIELHKRWWKRKKKEEGEHGLEYFYVEPL